MRLSKALTLLALLALLAGTALADPVAEGLRKQEAGWRQNGEALNPEGKIRRVLYPMGLADVGAAFMTFASRKGMPTDVMIVDGGGEFGTAAEIKAQMEAPGAKEAHFKYYGEFDYMHNGLPGRERIYGGRVLWELERIGARDVRIRYENGGTKARRPVVHLSFQLAGQERRVTIVQEWLGDGLPSRTVRSFLRQGYDALLEKASGPSLASEPDLIRFVKTATTHLDKQHGIVVTDDPAWVDMANLGLVPLEHVGDAPARFGYVAYRGEGKNPILRPARRTPRDGQAYLEKLVAEGARGGKRGLASLKRLADMQHKAFFLGRDAILLERYRTEANARGLKWSASATTRPLLDRLQHENDPDQIEATLDAIHAIGAPDSPELVFQTALARARKGQMVLPARFFKATFLEAEAEAQRVSVEDFLGWYDAIDAAEANGLAGKHAGALRESLRPGFAKALENADMVRRVLAMKAGQDDKSKHKMWSIEREMPLDELRRDGRSLVTAGFGAKTSPKLRPRHGPLATKGWRLRPDRP